MWKRTLAVFLGMLMFFVSSGVPAHAVVDQAVNEAIQATLEEQKQVELAATKLSLFRIRNEDGTFSIRVSAEALKSLGVSEEAYQRIRSGVDQVNQEIRAGVLVSDDQGSVVVKATGSSTILENENQIDFFWYGIRWGLSNTLVQRVVALITMGSAAAGIVAAITGAIPGAGVISAALWTLTGFLVLLAAWLTYLNAEGRGIFIHTTYVGTLLWGESQ